MAHKDSGRIHALFYSLVLSAMLNNLNPRIYLHFILTKIHDLRLKKINPISLLPDVIDRIELKAFANLQLKQAEEILATLQIA